MCQIQVLFFGAFWKAVFPNIFQLWLVESEEMEPSDTKRHGTFFSFPHSCLGMVWRSDLPLSHSGTQVPANFWCHNPNGLFCCLCPDGRWDRELLRSWPTGDTHHSRVHLLVTTGHMATHVS